MAKFLFVLSRGTEDPVRSTRCIQFAKVAKENGHDVTVFLVEDGVMVAKVGMVDNIKSPTGDELKVHLDYLVKEQVPILVCTPCANARQLSPDELVGSARLDTAKTLIALAAESKVFTF
jgi:predicted peroxiredoxin